MQKICPNCKQPNPPEAMFCRQCASSLGNAQAQQQQQYANPQQGNQPAWGPPQYGNQGMQQNFSQTSGGASGRAMAAAGLAVAGLFCCGIFTGIPGAILGWLEVSAIKEGKSSPAGMTMAQIGLWVGIIGSILNTIGTLILFALSALR